LTRATIYSDLEESEFTFKTDKFIFNTRISRQGKKEIYNIVSNARGT